jgi:hypothetical protein
LLLLKGCILYLLDAWLGNLLDGLLG